jgi:hypothetical protein
MVDGLGWGGGSNRSEDSLGKGKPEFKQIVGSRNMGISGRGVNNRPGSEVGDASRPGKNVGSNVGVDRSTQMVAEAKANKIVYIKKAEWTEAQIAADSRAAFVRAPRDMAEAYSSAEL